jgi:hypothetical protein
MAASRLCSATERPYPSIEIFKLRRPSSDTCCDRLSDLRYQGFRQTRLSPKTAASRHWLLCQKIRLWKQLALPLTHFASATGDAPGVLNQIERYRCDLINSSSPKHMYGSGVRCQMFCFTWHVGWCCTAISKAQASTDTLRGGAMKVASRKGQRTVPLLHRLRCGSKRSSP